MKKLEFNVFQKKLGEDKLNGHFPTMHCMNDANGFTFVMRSRNKLEYYTVVTFAEILRFANSKDMNPVEAIDMFVVNYCSNTLPIEAVEYEKLKTEIAVTVVDDDPPVDDISKKKLKFPGVGKNSKGKGCSPPNVRTVVKDDTIDAGEDMIIEAKDYSDFLLKFFDRMEKRVLAAVNTIDVEKSYVAKTFGEFIRNLFNTVNTRAFIVNVRRFIKEDLLNGLKSAEAELGMDLGFTELYEQKLNQLSAQQIDGYTINGKKWFGIKGVTKEIQASVIQTVQEGINANKGIDGIKADIKKDFANFSDWRSEMIARTETNRITNEGKLLGYKETGIEGGKVVKVAIDNRTSPICLRMNRKYGNKPIPLDDPFIDSETNKAFLAPPFHANCRTTIAFRPK